MKKKESEKSYAELSAEVDAIIAELEAGNLTLDEVVERASKASKLLKIAKEKLRTSSDEIDAMLKEL